MARGALAMALSTNRLARLERESYSANSRVLLDCVA
jgi:hypothetical protein